MTATAKNRQTTKTLFGNITESVQVIERTKLSEERTKTVLRVGQLTVTTTSNQPSEEAIRRAARIINEIAEQNVNEDLSGVA